MLSSKEAAPGFVKRSIDFKTQKKIVSVHPITGGKQFKEDEEFIVKSIDRETALFGTDIDHSKQNQNYMKRDSMYLDKQFNDQPVTTDRLSKRYLMPTTIH